MMSLQDLNISESLYWLLPELLLSGLIILLTILIILPFRSDKTQKITAFSGLLVLFAVIFYQHQVTGDAEVCCLFGSDMVVVDQEAMAWKLLLTAGMAIVLVMPLPLSMKRPRGEYFLLLLGVLLGGFLVVMANHFLMVIIGLELMSLCSYLLAGLARLKGAVESSIKYFLFGSAATAIMIYGISWLYGITGHISLDNAGLDLSVSAQYPAWMIYLVIVLVSGGILFKVSVAPWHIWVPDVYEETPTPVVAMFSVIPKLAGFAFLAKWVAWIGWPVEETAVLAILTMSIGNFAALRQENVKRMMGYSSIAHSGFLLMALLSPLQTGALFFYGVVFLLTNLGVFILINYYERMYRLLTLENYNGFFKLSPLFGICWVVLLISLTGLPPTGGFTAKLLVFSQVLGEYRETGIPVLMAVFVLGIINTVVSLAYYVRIPYRMIFRDMDSSVNIFKKYSYVENFLCLILVLGVLIIFFKPEWLMGWINSSSFAY